MIRVTLWEPEMSLPPRLLSADGAGIWKYQQHPIVLQKLKRENPGSEVCYSLGTYRVPADKFAKAEIAQ